MKRSNIQFLRLAFVLITFFMGLGAQAQVQLGLTGSVGVSLYPHQPSNATHAYTNYPGPTFTGGIFGQVHLGGRFWFGTELKAMQFYNYSFQRLFSGASSPTLQLETHVRSGYTAVAVPLLVGMEWGRTRLWAGVQAIGIVRGVTQLNGTSYLYGPPTEFRNRYVETQRGIKLGPRVDFSQGLTETLRLTGSLYAGFSNENPASGQQSFWHFYQIMVGVQWCAWDVKI